MTEMIEEAAAMDTKDTHAFITKIDMACAAINDQNRVFEGYGQGVEAAYKLLCEAQAIAPDNEAVTLEINKLRHIMDAAAKPEPVTETVMDSTLLEKSSSESTTSKSPSMAEQLMQQWQIKPVVEIFVCVSQNQLKGLADTIDSIANQIYSNWKLTIISNMPSPDPVFDRENILQWIQTDNFQQGLNNALSSSSSDWAGLIEAGGCLDSEALFSLANQDNLKGQRWQIVYSDEDHIDENQSYCQPVFKPDFDIERFKGSNHIGDFCFIRTALLQQLGGIRIDTEFSNDDLVLRAAKQIDANAIGHIANILYHRPFTANVDTHAQPETHSNVA